MLPFKAHDKALTSEGERSTHPPPRVSHKEEGACWWDSGMGKVLVRCRMETLFLLALLTRFDLQGMPLSGYLGKDDAPTWMQEELEGWGQWTQAIL